MNTLWNYFWPVLLAGLGSGIISGLIGLPRGRKRNLILAAGLFASLALAALWHGPLGGADRFAAEVERSSRQTLDFWEMAKVSGHLHHGPLTRRLLLSGPADEFQTSELVRIMGDVPGVSSAQWSPEPAGVPLIVQGLAGGVVGFLGGLVLAYLVELRRRYNAQWNW